MEKQETKTSGAADAAPESAASTKRSKLAIVLEGGLVQAVVSDHPEQFDADVVVIDYDTDGVTDDALSEVPQTDGSVSEAVVRGEGVEQPVIDRDGIVHKRSLEAHDTPRPPACDNAPADTSRVACTMVVCRIMHPINETTDGMSLAEIAQAIDQGPMIGTHHQTSTYPVPNAAVRPMLRQMGNDGTFFDDEFED